MSWADPCGKCGKHRASCDCEDGYHCVWPDEEELERLKNISQSNKEII